MMPELTLYFDIDPASGLQRIGRNQGREVNRLDLESLEFHTKVREGYEILLAKFPDRISRIDASLPVEEVYQLASARMKSLFADK
ncbi:Thymidylate kinase [Mycobacteroides abscessus subsp. abscessus]|nr:Thymidylate kinase [Mycobacteroides abscessus subsp. abscessus]